MTCAWQFAMTHPFLTALMAIAAASLMEVIVVLLTMGEKKRLLYYSFGFGSAFDIFATMLRWIS